MPDNTPSITDGYVKWLRDHVGSQLIYLVYGAAVIFDDERRVLVQKRYDFNWLGVPGGVMELDESLAETARREVLEETGIQAEIKGLAGVLSHPRYNLRYPNGDEVQQWSAVFWGEATGGSLIPDGGETLDTFFIDIDELLANTHPSHQAFVTMAQHARATGDAMLEDADSFPPLTPYYPILRANMDHERIILPGGIAVIEDDQGRILMVRRSDFNIWDYPSGFADLGETTTANVIREVEEETGLIVEPFAMIGIYSDPDRMHSIYPNGDHVHSVGPAFACRVVGGELDPAGHDNENTAAAFLTDEEIINDSQLPYASFVLQVLQDYRDRDGWPHMR